MSAFFVTATGTDIGKTFVTAGLIRHLRGKGARAAALKPIISGFSSENPVNSDSGVLLEVSGEPITNTAIARISPWRFEAALSPDMAAARETREIDYGNMVAFCRRAIAGAQGPLFIEGVGGIMVPLDSAHTVLDWMADLAMPPILVAGAYLGTISHTLSALSAMAARGLAPKVLVLNDTGDGPVPLAETAETIRRFAPQTAIAAIPRNAQDEDFAALAALLN